MTAYFEEEHELDLLEDLFEFLDLDGPDENQMHKLFDVFKTDMIDYPIFIKKIQLGHATERSRHPLFKGMPGGFEHICTRQSKHSGKRNFDPERSNRIHWIRPVIKFKDDARIKYFERVHSNGKNQQYYWFKERDYVVIVREINIRLQLVTAFKVDDIERRRFQNWFENY